MKKFLIVLSALMLYIGCLASFADESFLIDIKNENINFYNNLDNCTPYKHKKVNGLEVVGQSGSTCYSKINNKSCYLPEKINKEFASKAKSYNTKQLENIKTYGVTITNDESLKMNEEFNKVMQQFCQ